MKIYHKKNFAVGLGMSLLGAANLGLMFWKGRQVKGTVTALLCLLLGIGSLLRSLSRDMAREDILEERDERNRLVTLKCRSSALRLTQGISFVLMLLLFVLSKTSGQQSLLLVGLGLGLALSVKHLERAGCRALPPETHLRKRGSGDA